VSEKDGAPAGLPVTCPKCAGVIESPDHFHVIRQCPGCGRELRVFEPGEHGIGMRVNKGETLVLPPGALQFSLNPLKSTGAFTRSGIEWYWEMLSVGSLPKEEAQIGTALGTVSKEADSILRNSSMLLDCNLDTDEGTQKAFEILKDRRETVEWWALLTDMFSQIAGRAVETGDAGRAAWATACAERFRSMMLFKTNLAEVVWMGHSAKRIVDVLRLWEQNKRNADEEFWQLTFSESTYVLSQIFGVPLVFIADKAYVGGMTLTGTEARFVDYLFAVESSGEAIAIEIKVPTAPLLAKAKYRQSVYRPSPELSGSVVQILDYKNQLLRKLDGIARKESKELHAFNPKCVIVIGNAEELADVDRRRSFELFRSSLKDVEIITYDELFKKVQILATLFNLVPISTVKPQGG
jgi:hypothetical protein